MFLEPFSMNIKKQPGIKVPAYMYGTQFAEEPAPFPCNIPGTDYKTYYQEWGCPKWMTVVAVSSILIHNDLCSGYSLLLSRDNIWICLAS